MNNTHPVHVVGHGAVSGSGFGRHFISASLKLGSRVRNDGGVGEPCQAQNKRKDKFHCRRSVDGFSKEWIVGRSSDGDKGRELPQFVVGTNVVVCPWPFRSLEKSRHSEAFPVLRRPGRHPAE
jgi:hypothetical protein